VLSLVTPSGPPPIDPLGAGSYTALAMWDDTECAIPTSIIREVERTPKERIAILRQLGYKLYDFDLWEGG
jgi:hypothetical protein